MGCIKDGIIKYSKIEVIDVKKKTQRTPRNYDGIETTTHSINDLLSGVISRLNLRQQQRPDLILAAWPEIIGPKFAAVTQAVSFDSHVLVVRVKSSTLYSILSQHEKPRLLEMLRQRFPRTTINTIIFRMS